MSTPSPRDGLWKLTGYLHFFGTEGRHTRAHCSSPMLWQTPRNPCPPAQSRDSPHWARHTNSSKRSPVATMAQGSVWCPGLEPRLCSTTHTTQPALPLPKLTSPFNSWGGNQFCQVRLQSRWVWRLSSYVSLEVTSSLGSPVCGGPPGTVSGPNISLTIITGPGVASALAVWSKFLLVLQGTAGADRSDAARILTPWAPCLLAQAGQELWD